MIAAAFDTSGCEPWCIFAGLHGANDPCLGDSTRVSLTLHKRELPGAPAVEYEHLGVHVRTDAGEKSYVVMSYRQRVGSVGANLTASEARAAGSALLEAADKIERAAS